MKCYEGTILSVDASDGVYRYLVEDKGIILYVGNELPKSFTHLPVYSLGNRAIAPAFVDTHQHFASLSTFNAGLNVMEAESNEEIARMIGEYAAKTKEKTIIAFGASPHSVKEGRLINREEIDAVCKGKEVMVVKYDGHACIVSTPLLKKLDKKLSKLRGYHPDTGEMNQEAFFACSDYISGSLSIPDLFRNMQNCTDYLASKGIGSIHTVSGVGFIANLDITIEKLFARSLRNGFQIRVFPQALNTKVATSRNITRIGGCFECALDGCFGSHDAAMNEPYTDAEGGDGILYYSDEKVIEFCKKANRLGLQIELHAIGDKAFDQATRALRLHLMTTHVKTTGMASYMIVCRQLRASPYVRNTAYRCLFRAHSSDGSRNRIHTLKRFSEPKGHQGLILSRPLQTTASSFHWDPMPHALTPTLSSGFIGQSTTAILMKESQCSSHSEWLPIMAHTRPSTRRKEAVLKQVR